MKVALGIKSVINAETYPNCFWAHISQPLSVLNPTAYGNMNKMNDDNILCR